MYKTNSLCAIKLNISFMHVQYVFVIRMRQVRESYSPMPMFEFILNSKNTPIIY
jgi:hypothetical protein